MLFFLLYFGYFFLCFPLHFTEEPVLRHLLEKLFQLSVLFSILHNSDSISKRERQILPHLFVILKKNCHKILLYTLCQAKAHFHKVFTVSPIHRRNKAFRSKSRSRRARPHQRHISLARVRILTECFFTRMNYPVK